MDAAQRRNVIVFGLLWGVALSVVSIAFMTHGFARLGILTHALGPGGGWVLAGGLLAEYFGNRSRNVLAVGFGCIALNGFVLAVIEPVFGLGFADLFAVLFVRVWVSLALGLLLISSQAMVPVWTRATGILSAIAFVSTIGQGLFGGNFSVTGGAPPLWYVAHILLWLTILGWAATVWERSDSLADTNHRALPPFIS